MTFVIGIKCMNGLVLAADSLEGDGITKNYVNKLEVYQRRDWGLCWGCSSNNARVINKFSDKFKQSLNGVKKYDRNKIEAVMETCLKGIGKRYSYQDGVALIAGLYGQKIFKTIDPPSIKTTGMDWNLYKGDSGSACAALQEFHCCTGTGDNSLANFILRNTYFPGDRVSEVQKLAILITSLMKEYADAVGGQTRVWSLAFGNRCQWIPLLDFQIDEIEKEFSVKQIERTIREIRKNLF